MTPYSVLYIHNNQSKTFTTCPVITNNASGGLPNEHISNFNFYCYAIPDDTYTIMCILYYSLECLRRNMSGATERPPTASIYRNQYVLGVGTACARSPNKCRNTFGFQSIYTSCKKPFYSRCFRRPFFHFTYRKYIHTSFEGTQTKKR